MSARIVVTGAAGFIGSHLTDALLAAGHRVTGIDCYLDFYPRAYKDANLETAHARDGFTLLEEDLSARSAFSSGLERAFADAEVVFHLAAQAGVRGSWGTSFHTYSDCNVLATQRVLEACRCATPGRLVYASSSSVYGDAEHLPLREDGPCRPVSPYGVTKLAGEHLCHLYHAAFRLPVVSLRFFTVYGPRQRPDMAFHKLLRAALEGKPFKVFGDGRQTRDFTFVGDIVDGLLAAGGLLHGRPAAPPGSVINLGGGSRVTLRQAVETVEGVLGRTVGVDYGEEQAGDVRHTWADLSRAGELLGYEPRTSLADGLAAERAWLEHVVLARGLRSAYDP